MKSIAGKLNAKRYVFRASCFPGRTLDHAVAKAATLVDVPADVMAAPVAAKAAPAVVGDVMAAPAVAVAGVVLSITVRLWSK